MKVKFSRCTSSNLANVPQIDGQLIYTKDTNEVYLDVNNNRNKISDVIILNTIQERDSIVNPIVNKLYCVKEDNKFYRYENNSWVLVGGEDITACNLGLCSTYSINNRLNLNELSPGIYFLYRDTNYLYMKATYNGVEILGGYTNSETNIGNTLKLEIQREITDDLVPNTSIGNIVVEKITDGVSSTIGRYITVIKISRSGTEIDTSTGSGYRIEPVTKSNSQTISGEKTFTTLPKSSVVPTDDTHFVNKKYVDDNIGNINTILDSINGEVV